MIALSLLFLIIRMTSLMTFTISSVSCLFIYIPIEYSGRISTFKRWATLQPSLIKVVGEEKEFLKIQSFVVIQFAFDEVTVSTHLSNNSNARNLGAFPGLTFYLVALVPGLEKWVRDPLQ